MKILIVGGYGTFGGRLVDLVSNTADLEIIVAGRNITKGKAFVAVRNSIAKLEALAFDRNAPNLEGLKPDLVVDASGPFQAYGPDCYNLVEACIAERCNYIDLADAMPVPFSVSSFDLRTNFYRFVVNSNYSGVLFEIYGDTNIAMNGNVDLLARRSDLPAPDLYDFSFLQNGYDFANNTYLPEQLPLRTNIFIPDINATNWFLQIVNPVPNFGLVSGWICAKIADTNGMLFDCNGPPFMAIPAALKPGGPLSLAWNSVPGEKYAVEVTTNLKSWTTAATVKATNTRTTFTAPVVHAGPPRLYRVHHVRP